MQEILVELDPSYIINIANPTEAMCIKAVKENGLLLKDIQNPTEKVIKEYERELEAIKEQLPLDENVKKIRNLYEAYEKGTKEEIKAETKSEIYGIVHKWRQEYEKYGR